MFSACSGDIMSRCVVQGCSNSSNPAAGISLHWSPANKGLYAKWKAFVCLHQKNFNPTGRFMVCSEHFNEDCFKRLFHMEGNVRRLEPGSIPTVWRKSEKSVDPPLSHRSRRKVRIVLLLYIYIFYLYSAYIPCALIATSFRKEVLQILVYLRLIWHRARILCI